VECCGYKDLLQLEDVICVCSFGSFGDEFSAYDFVHGFGELVVFWSGVERTGSCKASINRCLLVDDHIRVERTLFRSTLALLLAVHGGGRRTSNSDQVAASVQSSLLVNCQHSHHSNNCSRGNFMRSLLWNPHLPGQTSKQHFFHLVN
jgi:hypothetical protein